MLSAYRAHFLHSTGQGFLHSQMKLGLAARGSSNRDGQKVRIAQFPSVSCPPAPRRDRVGITVRRTGSHSRKSRAPQALHTEQGKAPCSAGWHFRCELQHAVKGRQRMLVLLRRHYDPCWKRSSMSARMCPPHVGAQRTPRSAAGSSSGSQPPATSSTVAAMARDASRRRAGGPRRKTRQRRAKPWRRRATAPGRPTRDSAIPMAAKVAVPSALRSACAALRGMPNTPPPPAPKDQDAGARRRRGVGPWTVRGRDANSLPAGAASR